MLASLAIGAGGMLLKEFAPDLIEGVAGLFTDDDKAKEIGRVAVDTAKRLTGAGSEQAAAEQLRQDPELALKFERETNRKVMALAREETTRLRIVNETMQAEAGSDDAYVRRWRPTFGYVVALAWLLQFAAFVYVAIVNPQYVAEIVQAFAALQPVWAVALAVLGVNVTKRSEDKAVACGQPPKTGLIGALAERIRGGGK